MASVESTHAQATIRRLQKAIADGKYDQAQQIVDALDERQAKYLAFAMGLALFES